MASPSSLQFAFAPLFGSADISKKLQRTETNEVDETTRTLDMGDMLDA